MTEVNEFDLIEMLDCVKNRIQEETDFIAKHLGDEPNCNLAKGLQMNIDRLQRLVDRYEVKKC